MLSELFLQAEEEDLSVITQRLLDAIDLTAWQELLGDGSINLYSLLQGMIQGKIDMSAGHFLQLLVSGLCSGLSEMRFLLVQLCFLMLLSALMAQLSGKEVGISRTASMIIGSAGMLIILQALQKAITSLNQGCSLIGGMIEITFPLMSILLAAGGGTLTSSLLQPAFIGTIQAGVLLVRDLLIPLCSASGLMGLSGELMRKNGLSVLCGFLRKGIIWIMGGYMTLATGLSLLQAGTAATFDEVSLRAAKYAVDSMIPYIGGLFSDMTDVLAAGALLVKSAVGRAGILTMGLMILNPLCSMLCVYVCMEMCAAAGASLGSNLEGMAKTAANTVSVLITLLLILTACGILMLLMAISTAQGFIQVR